MEQLILVDDPWVTEFEDAWNQMAVEIVFNNDPVWEAIKARTHSRRESLDQLHEEVFARLMNKLDAATRGKKLRPDDFVRLLQKLGGSK